MRTLLLRALCLWTLCGLGLQSAVAADTQVSRMVLLQDEQSTKAFIDLSRPTAFKSFTLKTPDRAVLDIDAARLGPEFKLPGANGVVLSVRQGKTPTGLRLVFDLAQGAEVDAHLETAAGGPRLALEIRAEGVAPPSAALPPAIAAAPLGHAPVPAAPAAPVPQTAKSPSPPAVKPSGSTVPGRSNVGYALMDDEIVQIDIDSSGEKPKTTVNPGAAKAPPALPNLKPTINPGPAQALPKKAKTMNDVLGASARKLVIAIDAGHGGKDPGALGPNGGREKDVTLRVAKELAAAINADPGMKAVLIRDDDSFVVLQERYQRARRARADLFVSIHADAAQNNAASGSSVYVLSTKGESSQAARWLADKENAADLIGEGGKSVSLDDKERNLSVTLLDMVQNNTARMSEDAAGNVLQSLKDLGKAHKKEVEHANFVVLRSPDVPSMLVETGFITNPDEERKLSDPEHRRRLAYAIAQGLRAYFIAQPLPGTYYARRSAVSGGVNAAGSGIIP